MAGILIVYIHVIISWKITCEYFNLGRTRASDAFFNAIHVELGFHSSAEVWCKPGWPKTLNRNILRFLPCPFFALGPQFHKNHDILEVVHYNVKLLYYPPHISIPVHLPSPWLFIDMSYPE